MAVAWLATGCHGHEEHWLTFPWDDRGVLCSVPMDDLKEKVPWDLVEDQMALAEETGSVLTLHAHIPGVTISLAAIAHIFDLADAHHLAYLTYRDLAAPNPTPRAGLALAFDDETIAAWFGLRELFLARNVRLTFFVTKWEAASAREHEQLHTLFTDGHDIEPHSVTHAMVPAYVHDHGTAAYLRDEFQPSVDLLRAAGYPPPTAYAYPFGRDTAAVDAAILAVVAHVRVSPTACPYR